MVGALFDAVRFWISSPSLETVETIAPDPVYLRRLAAARRIHRGPRVRRTMGWLRRILPEAVVYRAFFVPLWIATLTVAAYRCYIEGIDLRLRDGVKLHGSRCWVTDRA